MMSILLMRETGASRRGTVEIQWPNFRRSGSSAITWRRATMLWCPTGRWWRRNTRAGLRLWAVVGIGDSPLRLGGLTLRLLDWWRRWRWKILSSMEVIWHRVLRFRRGSQTSSCRDTGSCRVLVTTYLLLARTHRPRSSSRRQALRARSIPHWIRSR
jgi:hypothetical protein